MDDEDGDTTYRFTRGTITTSKRFLRALEAWGVTRVRVFEAAGRVFLLGSSGEDRVANRVVVTGEASVRYL